MDVSRNWAGMHGYSVTPSGDYTHNGLGYDFSLLCKRPRVDYRISEYVMEYICKTILKPNSPLITGDYWMALHFYPFDKEKNTVPYNIYSVFEERADEILSRHYLNNNEFYNTEDTRFKTENSSWGKGYSVDCYSTKLNEHITPTEYANIVYDMIGAFLGTKYKRTTKEVMDSYKSGLDYDYIGSFEFPASFENQRYGDDGEVRAYYTEGEELDECEKMTYEKYLMYKKHFGECTK